MDDIIGIPQRTKLQVVIRKPYAWQVWTGVDDMQIPHTDWKGTFLELHDNGTAYHITVEPNGDETIITIK